MVIRIYVYGLRIWERESCSSEKPPVPPFIIRNREFISLSLTVVVYVLFLIGTFTTEINFRHWVTFTVIFTVSYLKI